MNRIYGSLYGKSRGPAATWLITAGQASGASVIMGVMAQWYSEYISERTKEGFEFFKDKPGFHANGRPWMGFKRLTRSGRSRGLHYRVPVAPTRCRFLGRPGIHWVTAHAANARSQGKPPEQKLAGFSTAAAPVYSERLGVRAQAAMPSRGEEVAVRMQFPVLD
jgi:hypothetical protein